MHEYIPRIAETSVEQALARSPAVAILGPRQCGKSTLAKAFLKNISSVYLDLQDRSARNRLTEPELLFDQHRNELICLDEIQQLPEFFSVLRSEIDHERRPGRFLILGSASRDLIRQSTESLAGRIAYLDLTPFLLQELKGHATWQTHWLRGGFPDSVLARDDDESFEWRRDFIRTFLERDIPGLGGNIPIPVIERLWLMLAHYHGQIVNYSKLAGAVDLSVPTLKKYLSILEQTYMVRLVRPNETNLKKRLVKSPKVYLRDTGILHSLLEIKDYDHLLSNPVAGASWESYAIENILAGYAHWRPSFVRTSNGAEIDLILERGDRRLLFEFKLSKAPKPSRGFHELVDALRPEAAVVIAPVDAPFEIRRGIQVDSPEGFLQKIR
jgi:uncharacterized protein